MFDGSQRLRSEFVNIRHFLPLTLLSYPPFVNSLPCPPPKLVSGCAPRLSSLAPGSPAVVTSQLVRLPSAQWLAQGEQTERTCTTVRREI